MKQREKAKEKAVMAIRKIVNAAKELADAEAAYYNRKVKKRKCGKKLLF